MGQTFDHGFIIQRVGQAGDDLDVLIVTCGDTNDQTGNIVFFFTKAYAFRVLAEHHAGFQHAVFGFYRTVRYCDGFTEVSRRQFFAVQHGIDVFRLNIAAFHQLFTGKANRFFFVRGFPAKEDIFRTQFEQMGITLIKAVFQVIADFLFVHVVALCSDQTFGQAGIQTAVEEVSQRDVLCLRHLTHRTFSQVAVGNDQIHIRRQIVNRAVGDGNLRQTGILHFLTQYACAHGAGTHTGIASHDDFTYMAQVVGHVASRQRRCAFRFRFHVLHTTGRRINIVFFFHFAGFQQDG